MDSTLSKATTRTIPTSYVHPLTLRVFEKENAETATLRRQMGQMMRDPATQAQLGNLLNDPAVLDQIIQSNPELRAMGPQVRELMRSEQFRSFLTDPAAMGQMRQMMQAGGGMPPGMGGMMGGAQGGAAPATQGAGGPLFNPWAANTPDAGAGAGTGGMGGAGMPDFARMMAQMGAGGGGGMGGFGGAPQLGAGPVIPPEERYQVRLATFLAFLGLRCVLTSSRP